MLTLNEKIEVDHIIPKAEGGEDTLKNKRAIHQLCHQIKTAEERRLRAINRAKASKVSEGQNPSKSS